MICTTCDQPIDLRAEDVHWMHEPWCTGDDICTCDLPVHPACCTDPACRPSECEGQLTIDEVLAVA